MIQLEGNKNWRIYEPVGFDFSVGRAIERHELTPLDRDIRLVPGDMVYIPRGAPHATMTGTSGSLHLSVAIEHAVAPVAGRDHTARPDMVSSVDIARDLSDIVSQIPETTTITLAADVVVTVEEATVTIVLGNSTLTFARDLAFGAALAKAGGNCAVRVADIDDDDLAAVSRGVRQKLLVVG